MLGFADYVIIMLVVLGMAAACRHIWRSWRNGSCPGCGCCGQTYTKKQIHTRKKMKENIEESKEIQPDCCKSGKKDCCSCGCSNCR